MQVGRVYLYDNIFTFEVCDKLEKIIAYGIGIRLETFLFSGLFLHHSDKSINLSHHCWLRWILLCQFNAKIEKNELKYVFLVLNTKSIRKF